MALQEDVDVVGVSAHSWEVLHYAGELAERLGAADPPIPVVVGGSVITEADRAEIVRLGIDAAVAPDSRRGHRRDVPRAGPWAACPGMTAALPTDLQAYFDHAAHAAARIRDLLPLYTEQLGGRFLYGGDNPRVGYRGVVLGFAGGGKVELLEPLAGSSFFDSFFARHPAGGLHHLDVPRGRRAPRDRPRPRGGLQIVGVNEDEPEWREAFVHPRSGHGVLVQFVESNPDYPRLAPGQTLESTLAGEAA